MLFVVSMVRLIPPTLLLGKIDNARARVGPTIAMCFAVVAVIDREFRLDQLDGQNLAMPFLRCTSSA